MCVCVCLSSHKCVFLCMCVFECGCVRARARVCVFACISILMCVCLYACMLASNCCVCIGQTSPLSSVRLRMQSSPCSADSHFLRWLTAVDVNNNNICSIFIYLPNYVRYCTPTEDGDAKFIFYFKFLKSTVERMNERILQLISPPRKLKGNARRCVFPAVDGN